MKSSEKSATKTLILFAVFSIFIPALVAALTTKAILSASGFDEKHASKSHTDHAGSESQETAGKKPVPTPSVPQGQGKGCGPGHPHGDIWQVRNEQAQGFELRKCWEGSETTLIDYKD